MRYFYMHNVMTFGKHKGLTLERVKYLYPHYYKWLIEKRVVEIMPEPLHDLEFRELINEIL